MSTGICSSLLHNFPYHNDDPALQTAAFVLFLIDFTLFIFLFIWLVLRWMMFPGVSISYYMFSLPMTVLARIGIQYSWIQGTSYSQALQLTDWLH